MDDRPGMGYADRLQKKWSREDQEAPARVGGVFYASCSPLPLCGHFSRAECARDRGLTLHTCKRSGFSSLPGKNARYNPLEPHGLMASGAVGGID
jgi:hypothetical protein